MNGRRGLFYRSDKGGHNPMGMVANETRKRSEYFEGRRAFGLSKIADDCPYEVGHNARVGWHVGYYDARTKESLGHVFERNGIDFPGEDE